MRGIIYRFTNIINGRVYIGQTINEKSRYSDHKRAYSDSVFHRAIKKYGFDNFKYEILHVVAGKTKEEVVKNLNTLEIKEIEKHKSLTTQNGYNVDIGGDSSPQSEETKLKISRANKGRPSPFKGTKASEEVKRNMSVARTKYRYIVDGIYYKTLKDVCDVFGWDKNRLDHFLRSNNGVIFINHRVRREKIK